jgi:site-specific DNA-cytosine methylase
MNTLELFAGSRSFSKVAEQLGHRVYTTDNQDFENIDLVCDIFDFDCSKLPYKPDIIWASPPCTTFSIASCFHHWNKDKTPKTEKCKIGINIIQKTIDIINELKPKYYFIENPRGLLRKQDMMQPFPRKTVTYCSYGDMRMKPTDIWTNFDFETRPMCFNGNRDCHHEPAPRGSKTGTQGLKSDYLRSQIPPALFEDIFKELENEGT